jgi:hypothetical protein
MRARYFLSKLWAACFCVFRSGRFARSTRPLRCSFSSPFLARYESQNPLFELSLGIYESLWDDLRGPFVSKQALRGVFCAVLGKIKTFESSNIAFFSFSVFAAMYEDLSFRETISPFPSTFY